MSDAPQPDLDRPRGAADERRVRRLQLYGLVQTLVILFLAGGAVVVGLQPERFGCAIGRPAASPPRVAPRGELVAEEQATIDVFEQVAPSVVFVSTTVVRRDFFMNARSVPQGTGTGFVWDEAGHIVTNFHVIQGASEVEVGLADGRAVAAEVVGAWPDKDVAVLRAEEAIDLPPIPRGTSGDLRVGQRVLAIGNPFGLDHTLTSGIVSAVGRSIESANGRIIEGVIQTDAAINPGNSGGPLLDSAGRLIGVNTAIVSGTGASAGIGFAVPVDTVARVATQLIAHGTVIRPTLGVRLAPEHVARRYGVEGVLVVDVVRGSGAERAGIRGTRQDGRRVLLGDAIVRIRDRDVRRLDDLLNELELLKPGDTVDVTILRDGDELELEVDLTAPG